MRKRARVCPPRRFSSTLYLYRPPWWICRWVEIICIYFAFNQCCNLQESQMGDEVAVTGSFIPGIEFSLNHDLNIRFSKYIRLWFLDHAFLYSAWSSNFLFSSVPNWFFSLHVRHCSTPFWICRLKLENISRMFSSLPSETRACATRDSCPLKTREIKYQ